MKVSDYIVNRIDRLPKGYVFTYMDFIEEVNKREAIIKALNRMASNGRIVKLTKGKYYKPEKTPFGDLLPDKYEIVKDLLEDDDKVIGYLTGLSIYNDLKLSTQISNVIEIGRKDAKPTTRRERYKIKFLVQRNTITKDNIPLLQILDAIKNINKIPDSTVASSFNRLKSIIISLTETEINTIVRLSLKYPPSTRALLGAMLESSNMGNNIKLISTLQSSLNPITKYEFNNLSKEYSINPRWNIV